MLLIPHTLGFGLHIITAHCRSHTWSHRNKMEKTSLFNSYKGTLVGGGAAITIWLILFLPITALLIQSSINRIVAILAV
jgi:hypothetical protein